MPPIEVRAFRETKTSIPLIKGWLEDLRTRDRKAFELCLLRITQLEKEGHALQRPLSAPLRDGIYELRLKSGKVQYRMLYFFNSNQFACLSHGMIKRGAKVPDIEIDRAIDNKRRVISDPDTYTTGLN